MTRQQKEKEKIAGESNTPSPLLPGCQAEEEKERKGNRLGASLFLAQPFPFSFLGSVVGSRLRG